VFVSAAVGLFALQALPLRGWLIDDAGISLAYARNFAKGMGLVAQPGMPPVEGFSNPLWTLLLAAFAAVEALDVVMTLKILSLALVAAAFAMLARCSGPPEHGGPWPSALPLVLLPLNASFVIWTASGLENALLTLLVVASAALSLRAAEGRGRPDFASGLVSGLLALTRPDAVVYATAYPIVLAARAWGGGDLRGVIGRLRRYAAGIVPVLGSYLAFRLSYYGDWAPNTYYAKERPAILSLLDLGKLGDLLASLAGPWTTPLLGLLVVATVRLGIGHRFGPRLRVLALYLGLATASYLLLPIDWMGEYRFATAFFVFFYWFAGQVLGAVAELSREGPPLPRLVTVAATCSAVAATALVHGERSRAFAAGPIVPFARVAAFSGHGYNDLAEILGAPDASLLTPDLGGTLYYSRLRVYDLAGLCDPVIARTLRDDRPRFLDYVFEEARPTFIHAHASWAEWAAFVDDPRFSRDYVPVSETWERPPGHGMRRADIPWSADHVRRDALAGEGATLARLRSRFRELDLPALSP
jgi:hypothetical protein